METTGAAVRVATKSKLGGFTFVELLVAMTIIGLLANIVIPKAWEVRRRAEGASLIGDYGAIRTAVLDFYAAHSELPESGSMGSVPPDLVGSLPNGFTFSPNGAQYLWFKYPTPVPLLGRTVVGIVVMIADDIRLANSVGGTYKGDDLYQFGSLLMFMIS